jgi:hypothetical protein
MGKKYVLKIIAYNGYYLMVTLSLQVTQPVGYVGTLPSVQFEYTWEHGRVDRKGRQHGLQGTVRMSTCESMAEWTTRDISVDCKGLYVWVHVRAWQSGLQGTVGTSTCESMAEWTARDHTYKYMWEHGRMDRKGLYLRVHVRARQSGPQGTLCSIS